MLLINLTDGVQDVQGMEYSTIPCLSPQTPPGTKVLFCLRLCYCQKCFTRPSGYPLNNNIHPSHQKLLLEGVVDEKEDVVHAFPDIY